MGGSGSEGPVSTPRHPHRDWRKALLRCIVVEAAKVLQCCSVAQLVLVLQGSNEGNMSSGDTRTVGCRVQHPETSGPSLL